MGPVTTEETLGKQQAKNLFNELTRSTQALYVGPVALYQKMYQKNNRVAENREERMKAKFLTQDQIQEFRECFSLYDKTRRGKISTGDLITVMRCLGTKPTPGEVERHMLHHKIGRNGELDFSTFLNIIHRQQQQEDPEREIREAMLMADKEKRGFITATELRTKLTQMGEKLTNREVDELLRQANISPNGIVKYEDFIRTILLPPADY